MEIGETIKKHRKLIRLSQEELAERTGLSRVSIGNYERGDRKPSPEALKMLSIEFKVPHDYLMGIAGYITKPHGILELESKFWILDTERNELESGLEEIDNELIRVPKDEDLRDLRDNLTKQLYSIEFEQDQISKEIRISTLKDSELEHFKGHPEKSLREYMAKLNMQENRATAIYLNENNEGNFYFFKDGGILPEETQEKLRALIKLTLD